MGILVSIHTRKVFAFLVLFLFNFSLCASVLTNVQAKFRDCEISQDSLFPNETELKNLKSKDNTKFFNYFNKKCGDEKSIVFIHSDIVRTQLQFVLVEVKDQKIQNIEILKFLEPTEYKVASYWLEKFRGLSMDFPKVDAVSGATLTSHSINYLALLSLKLEGIINSHAKK